MHKSKTEISRRTKKKTDQFERDIKAGHLAYDTDRALNALIRLGWYKLSRVGQKEAANKMLREWEGQWQGEVSRLWLTRGIGDHRPLSQWLAEKYTMMEFLLGKDVCHALRLDDIKTINFGIPVVISCVDNVDEVEYGRHFIADEVNGYRGLGPVVAFWVTEFACVGFTWGTGFLYCGPIAMGVEYLTKQFVAPRLNHPLWNLVCQKEAWYASMDN